MPGGGCADYRFPGKSRKTGGIGNSNLWFPISSIEPAVASGCRPCRPENRRNRPLQSMAVDFVCCCAAAGGCRLSLPAASGCRPCRPENRRNRPLQFMAVDFVCCCAAAGGCRLSLPDPSVALRRQLSFHGSLLRFRTVSPLSGEAQFTRRERQHFSLPRTHAGVRRITPFLSRWIADQSAFRERSGEGLFSEKPPSRRSPHSSTVTRSMRCSALGRSLRSVGVDAIWSTTSMPSITLPKAAYWPSRWGAFWCMMKN